MLARLLAVSMFLLPCVVFAQDHAIYVSASNVVDGGSWVPTTVTTAEDLDLKVTMQNAGPTAWPRGSYVISPTDSTEDLWDDPGSWFPMVPNSPASIVPGAQATFEIKVVAPATPGPYPFQWLVSGPTGKFADATPLTTMIVRVSPPKYLSPNAATFPEHARFNRGTTAVSLSWAPVSAASYYRVDVVDAAGGVDSVHTNCVVAGDYLCYQTTTNATTWTGLNVTPGHSYSWRVISYTATDANPSDWATFSIDGPSGSDTTWPTATIETPLPSDVVFGTVPVSVVADDDRGLGEIRWSVDGVVQKDLIAPVDGSGYPVPLTAPFVWLMDTTKFSGGLHHLRATAYDTSGHVTDSSLVDVTVDNTVQNASCTPPLGSGDDGAAISALFESATTKRVILCPASTYHLRSWVYFSHPGQQLFTQGLPTTNRAKLVVSGHFSSVDGAAIVGWGFSNVQVRNIEVDGNRNLGAKIDKSEALIALGGSPGYPVAVDQYVDQVKAYDTRTWSTFHTVSGGCDRLVFTRNEIGPAGFSTDSKWSDGASIDCLHSYLANNQIVDATDGAIVMFKTAGSLVQSNTLRSLTRNSFGGIGLVDVTDYHGVKIDSNTITASGPTIAGAIGMGHRANGCSRSQTPAFGATITNNAISGSRIGYGLLANGVADWTVLGNTDTATHGGSTPVCPHGTSAPPQAFLRSSSDTAGGNYQSDFATGFAQAFAGVTGGTLADRLLSWGIPTYGISGVKGQQQYWSVTVPPGTAKVTFTTSAGTGDADLYVYFNGPSGMGTYQCSSVSSTTNETCTLTSPLPGTYYVLVSAWTDFSGVQLLASSSGVMTPSTSVKELSSTVSTAIYMSLAVPQGTHTVWFNMSGGTGDADLYVKIGQPPTLSSFDCRPYISGNNETCTLTVTGPTTANVMINDYSDYAGVTLTPTLQ